MTPRLAAPYRRHLNNGTGRELVQNYPWPHFVLDGFIEPGDFVRTRDRVLATAGEFEVDPFRGLDIQLQLMLDEDLATFFFSAEVRALLEQMAGAKLRPDEDVAIQLRRMTPASPAFPPHVDGRDEGAIVALYYLAEGWTPECGGELLLLEDERADASRARRLEPRANRLVVFESNDRHWHAVRQVHGWERFMVVTNWKVRKNGP